MKLLLELAKANEYPQKYHWKIPMNDDMIQNHIIERADFRRAKPEYRKAKPGTIIQIMEEAIVKRST